MNTTDETLGTEDLYFVVINDEEQYSIWPVWRDLPDGWDAVGEARDREVCLDWIEEHWTDMRPASLRKFLAETEKQKNK
jgi:MbtH protein